MATIVRIKRTDYGEWRMNPLFGIEATAYYTPDLDDAVYTAIAEYGEDVEIKGSVAVLKEVTRILLERRNKNESQR